MDKWFSGPMILSYFVVGVLWIFLQIALEADIKWIIINPLNLLFVVNIIIGITYQFKQKDDTQ